MKLNNLAALLSTTIIASSSFDVWAGLNREQLEARSAARVAKKYNIPFTSEVKKQIEESNPKNKAEAYKQFSVKILEGAKHQKQIKELNKELQVTREKENKQAKNQQEQIKELNKELQEAREKEKALIAGLNGMRDLEDKLKKANALRTQESKDHQKKIQQLEIDLQNAIKSKSTEDLTKLKNKLINKDKEVTTLKANLKNMKAAQEGHAKAQKHIEKLQKELQAAKKQKVTKETQTESFDSADGENPAYIEDVSSEYDLQSQSSTQSNFDDFDDEDIGFMKLPIEQQSYAYKVGLRFEYIQHVINQLYSAMQNVRKWEHQSEAKKAQLADKFVNKTQVNISQKFLKDCSNNLRGELKEKLKSYLILTDINNGDNPKINDKEFNEWITNTNILSKIALRIIELHEQEKKVN